MPGPSEEYRAGRGGQPSSAPELAGLPLPVGVADAVRRGVLGDSGRLLARRVECGDKRASSLAIIREDVGLMNDGSGNVW